MATYRFNEKRKRFVIRYYDQTGRRGWETMPKGTTAKEAKRRTREIEESIEKKTFRRPTQIPIFQEVAAQWISAKSVRVRHTTTDQYKGHINHLNQFFNGMRTSEVSLELVEEFITQCTNQGMFANTIRKVITTLGSIMAYAAHPKRNYAPYNPVPYVENRPEKIKKEAEMATPEEVLAIRDKMDHPRDRLLILTAATTGMREGELFGLQWGDIQWKDSQIFVRRTYNHGKFYDPKSKRSKRKIDVPQELLHELKKWKLACPKGELDLVFPTRSGRPENASRWILQVWHPARRRAGIRHLTPHSLRHFNGSFLLDQGEGVGYVQDHLGHSSATITMDVYRHKIRKCNPNAAEKLGKTFFSRDGCKSGAIEPKRGAIDQI